MTERGPEERPVPDPGASFHARLRDRYGARAQHLDPAIELEGPESDARRRTDDPGVGRAAGPEEDSGTSRGLFQKLSSTGTTSVRYRVGEEVGRGGMGTVIRVWDQDLRRTLAMKVLTHTPTASGPMGEKDEERLSRFLEEAQITGQLDHPGIVPVHDMGIGEDGRLYFTMRLVRGRELKDVLDLARERREGWTTTRAIGLVLKVCEAMAFAHSKGVVHRDLKPANVMVGRFGEVYVMDWGLARVIGKRDATPRAVRRNDDPSSMSLVRTVRREESQLDPESPLITLDGDVVGTPSYMALEQAQGKLEELGARSDVYSLGAILYYMLTGRAPYVEPGERISPHVVLQRVLEGPPEPVSKLATGAPAELVAVCEKAMAREAHERYEGMLEVADDLQAYLEGRVVRAYEVGAWAEIRKWCARNKGMALSLVGICVLILASVVGFALQKDQQVAKIAQEQKITKAAQTQAEINAQRAEASRRLAEENLELAEQQRQEAARNAEIAAANFEDARRSVYTGAVSAANYCLLLDDAGDARRYLGQAEEDLRGWEWDHLSLRADGATMATELEAAIIQALRPSPDGSRVYSVTTAGRWFTHDLETGEELDRVIADITTFLGRREQRAVALGPSGELAVVKPSEISLRSPGVPEKREITGEVLTLLAGKSVGSVAFSPDGRTLSIGLDDGSLVLVDLAHGTARSLVPQGSPIARHVWSPDGTRVLALLEGGGVRLVDVGGGAQALSARTISLPRGLVPTALAWSADGGRFLTGDEAGGVALWEVDGTPVRTLDRHDEAITCIAVRGESIASACASGVIHLLQPREGREGLRTTVLRGHDVPVSEVCILPGERRLVSGDLSGWVRTWDARGDGARDWFRADVALASGGAVFPDGERVVVCGNAGFLGLYELESGRRLRIFRGHEEGTNVTAVAISSDGTRLLSGGSDKTARLWDVATGDQLAILRGHEKWISAVALSPDGRRAYTGSSDQTVRVWNCRTGELLETLQGHRSRVYDLALSPDGTRLASCSNEVLVWDLGTGELVHRLEGHERGKTRSVAFAGDGLRLLTGSTLGELGVWTLQPGASDEDVHASATFHLEQEGMLRSLDFQPGDARLLTVARGGGTLVRDGATCEVLMELVVPPDENGNPREVLAASFHEDGRSVTAVTTDGTVVSWFSDGRRARFERWYTGREDARRMREVLEAALFDSPRVEDMPRTLQGRADLEPEFRTRALAEAEWIAGMPHWFDRVHRERLSSGALEAVDLELMLARVEDTCERWPRHPHLILTHGATLVRLGRFAEAERKLREALRVSGSTDPLPGGPVLQDRDRQVRRMLLVLALAGQGEVERATDEWRALERELEADATFDPTGPLAALREEAARSVAEVTGV